MARIEISSYEEMRDSLRVRLMDINSNRETLRNAIYEQVGCGYALVAYIDLPEGGIANVPRGFAESAGFSTRQIMTDARAGSEVSDRAKLCVIRDMLLGGDKSDLLSGERIPEKGTLLVLTTDNGLLGAAALYYPDVQSRISEIVGGDYYVLPSSVHEVIIMPDDGKLDPKELANMVKEINEHQVLPNERLGNRVMHFRADIERLQVAADMDREPVRSRERA